MTWLKKIGFPIQRVHTENEVVYKIDFSINFNVLQNKGYIKNKPFLVFQRRERINVKSILFVVKHRLGSFF